MPGDVLNLAAQQLPVFLLAAKFGIATAGFYALTQRVLGMPVSLLGNAIGDVFKSQASREYVRTGSCRRLFVKCFLALFALSSVLFASSAIVSPQLFPAVFGKKWGEAGEYARILSLMYFFALMSSPLSYIYYVVEMQFLSLVWQAFLCASVSAALWLAPVAKGPKTAILWFSIAYSAMYVINLAVSFHLTQRKSAAVKT
jgi:O-antigen/teichoic acid export membrane protein